MNVDEACSYAYQRMEEDAFFTCKPFGCVRKLSGWFAGGRNVCGRAFEDVGKCRRRYCEVNV